MNKIMEAARFAEEAHRGQFRKYTGDEYIVHPMRVAGTMAMHPEANENMVIAAYLHDVVEDTDCVIDDIFEKFGFSVAGMVEELTKPDDEEFNKKTRVERRRIVRESLKKASYGARMVKLADRIDNLRDLRNPKSPEDFVKLYVRESYELFQALMETDGFLGGVLFSLVLKMKEEYGE